METHILEIAQTGLACFLWADEGTQWRVVLRSVSHSWGEHVSPTYRGMEFSAFLCPAVPVHTARKGKSKDFSIVLPELSCGPQKALTASNLNFLGFKINALCSPVWLQTHDPPASLSVLTFHQAHPTLDILYKYQVSAEWEAESYWGLQLAYLGMVFLHVFPWAQLPGCWCSRHGGVVKWLGNVVLNNWSFSELMDPATLHCCV